MRNKKIIKIKKNIDFLIYYRIHSNKNYDFLKKILSVNNFKKNYSIGNNFSFKGVNNLGVISHLKTQNLLSRSKFTFVTSENLNSFYCMDSILNSVNIFFDNKHPNIHKSFFSNYVKFNKFKLYKPYYKKNFVYKFQKIEKKKLDILHQSTVIFFKNYFY